MNPQKYSALFDNTFLSITGNESIPEHFQFVATVSDYKESSYIHGKINTVKEDESFHELDFEWTLKQIDVSQTKISYRIYTEDNLETVSPIINLISNAKMNVLISSSVVGLASLEVIPTTTVAAGGTLMSKSILTAIFIVSVAAISGIVVMLRG